MSGTLGKIVFWNSGNTGDLSPEVRKAIRMNDRLGLALSENEALNAISIEYSGNSEEPPDIRSTLDAAFLRASNLKEVKQSMFSYLFTGKRWYLQIAAALLFAISICAYAFLPGNPGWAQTDGWVLEYKLGQSSEGRDPETAFQTTIESAQKALHEYLLAIRETNPDQPKSNVIVNVNSRNGVVTLSIAVLGNDSITADDVKEVLSTVPGLPVPVVTDATWFSRNGLPGEGLLSLMLDDHLFHFPISASKAEMESALNEWLAINRPGKKANVEVLVSTSQDEEGGERKEVKVKIEIVDGKES